jgi:hypothetical protein
LPVWRLLKRPTRRRPDLLATVLSPVDRELLLSQTIAMSAGFIGWFACAMFASVAYNWTFYYLLALIVVTRELVFVRIAAAVAFQRTAENSRAAGKAKFFRPAAARFA